MRARLANIGIALLALGLAPAAGAQSHPETLGLIAAGGKAAACSGVLIAPRIVLTARGCIGPDGIETGAAAAFGSDLNTPTETIPVVDVAWMRPDAAAGVDWEGGLGLALLARPARARPAPIAPAGRIRAAKTMLVLGYALRQDGGAGLRQTKSRIAIVSQDCRNEARASFGCDPGEMAALLTPPDPARCAGDAGAPAYVTMGKSRALAAIYSRPLFGSADLKPSAEYFACGKGGIFTPVAGASLTWVVKTAKNWGVRIPLDM